MTKDVVREWSHVNEKHQQKGEEAQAVQLGPVQLRLSSGVIHVALSTDAPNLPPGLTLSPDIA